MARNWYKLDNAAKIFPAIYSQSDRNGFRISALFTSDIQEEPLYDALLKTLERYPTFCVRLKKGFFWYYFEHNYEKPMILKEPSQVFSSIQLYKYNGYLFSVSTNGKRLVLEVFHALGDGTGAMEFFKTLCFYYLTNLNITIDNSKGLIKTDEIEQTISEADDSFNLNYDKKVKQYGKEDKAYQFKGRRYDHNWIGLVHADMQLDTLKETAHKYDCTITEYIGAVMLDSAYNLFFKGKKEKKNMKIIIPVNARHFFDSKTIRNFALFVRTNLDVEDSNLTFDDMIVEMKRTFKEELNHDKLASRIVQNVRFERLFIVRAMPLFIKNLAMKIGYRILGGSTSTISFSNLGKVEIPDEMKQYIERFEFCIGVSKDTPTNMAAVSYGNRFVLTFSTLLIDRKFIETVLRRIHQDGVELSIDTNDLEVSQDETL